jgi:hypothetical protein
MSLRSRAGSPCHAAAATGRSPQQHGRFRSRRRSRILAAGAAAAACGVAAGCSRSSPTSSGTTDTTAQRAHPDKRTQRPLRKACAGGG